MVVAIKWKARTTGPLVEHRPQHSGAVLLSEHIVFINKEKPTVLLMGVLLTQEPHRMNNSLNTNFQPP